MAGETLRLAKAWVRQSEKGPNQREEEMWAEIAEYLREQWGIDRSANAIRTKWSTLQQDVQIYLAA